MTKAPAFQICTIIPAKQENKPDKFLNIGAAWWSQNGEAINLVFEAAPVNGNRVVLVPNKGRESASET